MQDDFPDEVKGFGGNGRGIQSTKVNQLAQPNLNKLDSVRSQNQLGSSLMDP
jgi:hypothetical protein